MERHLNYYFEVKAETDRMFGKIFFMLLVISTVAMGVIIYSIYSQYPTGELSFAGINCDQTVVSTHQFDAGGASFTQLRGALESELGYGEDTLKYKLLENTRYCNDYSTGMWFEHQSDGTRVAYCTFDKKVVVLNTTECREVSDLEYVNKIVDDFRTAFNRT